MRWLPCLLLLSCASPSTDWVGDSTFSSSERADIEAGFAWLAEHAEKPVPSVSWTLSRDVQPLPHTIRRERGPNLEMRGGECVGNAIYLDPGDFIKGLAAHELGHCWLGFKDNLGGSGIMSRVDPMVWSDFEASSLASVLAD